MDLCKCRKFNPLQYAEMACDTIMKKFDAASLPPVGKFHYHQGVFLSGMEKCYVQSNKKNYFNYIKAWVDSNISYNGSIREFCKTELDDLQPGILLFSLYKKTNDERYKKALFTLVSLLETWKTNKEGGFWHKDHYPNQMWLDGLYMAGPLAVQFADEFNKDKYFNMIATQAILMEKHTKDENTGLLRHGWDSSKKAIWADSGNGKAPESWGRAIGWYLVAVIDILEYLPKSNPNRGILLEIISSLIESVIRFQDDKTGLWYQVVNKGNNDDNWLEISCSCLFVYAIAKGVGKGYFEKDILKYAHKGYEGVIKSLKYDENGGLIIGNICIGTGIGDYQHYVNRPTSENDLHGAGAFILMCSEMNFVYTKE